MQQRTARGYTDGMLQLTTQQVAAWLPPRPRDAHKGVFGHALVVAGALGFAGAARLAAEGALRSGTGLVTLAVPARIQDTCAAALPEAMTRGLPCDADGTFAPAGAAEAARLARARTACVVGPGLTTGDGVARFLHGFLALVGETALVLDADALNLIALGAATLAPGGRAVLTPHPGEAARLLGTGVAEVQADRPAAASALAERYAATVILKGHGTLIAAPDGRIALNRTGGHGLAKGGSGDTLAGIVGGLLAQGLAPFEAACVGAHAHGIAGDLAEAAHGARAMLARDVLAALGAAWRQIEAEA